MPWKLLYIYRTSIGTSYLTIHQSFPHPSDPNKTYLSPGTVAVLMPSRILVPIDQLPSTILQCTLRAAGTVPCTNTVPCFSLFLNQVVRQQSYRNPGTVAVLMPWHIKSNNFSILISFILPPGTVP